jgi:Zn-dependent protease
MSLPGARTTYDWRAFAISGIPITFSPWFLLVVWACLARAGSLEAGLVHLVAVTASVLVHELGHGLTARRQGLKASILLHGFGGWCEHGEAYTRNDALQIVVGGPAAGLALGGVAWALGHALREPPWWLAILLDDLAWMGLFWSAVNLLPILPLDGGSILENLLERRRSIAFPSRTTRQVGVIVAILAMIGGLWLGEVTALLLLALLAWDNGAALGWWPSIPGLSMVRPAGDAGRVPSAAGFAPTRAVAVVIALIAIPALLRAFADVEGPLGAWLALEPRSVLQVWRLVTWPLVPMGRPLTLVSAVVALALVGPTVERRRGWRTIAGLAVGSTVVAGLAGTAAAAGTGGVLAGPVALVLAFVAAWACVGGGALGPSAVIPVTPPVALLGILAIDLADRWSFRDAPGAASDLAAVAVGLLVGGGSGGTRRLWQRAELWWKLRNPPKVQIRSANRPD